VLFKIWREKHAAEVEAFEEFLVREHVAEVVPTLPAAAQRIHVERVPRGPFRAPAHAGMGKVRDLLLLLRELRGGRCSRFRSRFGVPRPSPQPLRRRRARQLHIHFAVDIAPLQAEVGARLCEFWREEGESWNMGVSRYPTGASTSIAMATGPGARATNEGAAIAYGECKADAPLSIWMISA
jgi:hypothetical protein